MLNNLHFFQILQNAVTILLFSVNSAVYLLSKVCWFYSLHSFLQFKTNKYSLLTGGTFPSSKDDFVLVVRTVQLFLLPKNNQGLEHATIWDNISADTGGIQGKPCYLPPSVQLLDCQLSMYIVLTDFKLYIYFGPLTTDTPEHVSAAGLITFLKEPSPLSRKKKKKPKIVNESLGLVTSKQKNQNEKLLECVQRSTGLEWHRLSEKTLLNCGLQEYCL